MVKFDYSYYRDVFGGELGEAEFNRAAKVARDVVAVLIGGVPGDASDEPLVRALCLETDEAARVCDSRDRVSREALGDYSVSYFESMPDTVCGIPVSSEAILALTGGGYLTRWA